MAKRGQRDGLAVPGQEEADRMVGRLDHRARPESRAGQRALGSRHHGRGLCGAGRLAARPRTGSAAMPAIPRVTAFQLGGTIRQLEEVWGIKADGSEAGQMLMAMKTKLLSKRGGEVTMTREECVGVLTQGQLSASPVAQSILGQEGPVRFEWLSLGMQRPPAIARICRRSGLGRRHRLPGRSQPAVDAACRALSQRVAAADQHPRRQQGPAPSAMTPG